MTYQIAGASEKLFSKDKNGDAYKHFHLEDEGLLVAVVSDGISKLPTDWKASDEACDKFETYFRSNKNLPLKERILTTVEQTNQALLDIEEPHKGLGCTLSAMVVDFNSSTAMIANLGDSRIFRISESDVEQITTDDAVNRTKTIVTNIGRQVVHDSYLTNYLGISDIKINQMELSVEKGNLFVLASDGFYDTSVRVNSKLMEMFGQESLNDAFMKVFNSLILAKDDRTAIAIKLG